MSDKFSINDFLKSASAFHETRNNDENSRYRSWNIVIKFLMRNMMNYSLLP